MIRRLGLALAAVLLIAASAHAYDYYAFEQVTVANTAIGLTSATISQGGGHKQVVAASCRIETAEVRYRFDGTAPTSTVGALLEPGDTIVLTDAVAMKQLQFIRTGSTSATASCSYVG